MVEAHKHYWYLIILGIYQFQQTIHKKLFCYNGTDNTPNTKGPAFLLNIRLRRGVLEAKKGFVKQCGPLTSGIT